MMSDDLPPPVQTSYPLVLTTLSAALCVVIGGGAVAERKIQGLLAAGARVQVISPAASSQIQRWADAGEIGWLAREYAPGDLAQARLAFAATSRRAVNAAVVAEARARDILANCADDPAASDFHTVAAVRRGSALIGISTGGDSPAFSALLRRQIEALLGPEVEELLEILRQLRHATADWPAAQRAALLRQIASDEVLDQLRAGRRDEVMALIKFQVPSFKFQSTERFPLEA